MKNMNIKILQDSGETHWRCVGKYYCQFLQIVQKFWKSFNICKRYETNVSGMFLIYSAYYKLCITIFKHILLFFCNAILR